MRVAESRVSVLDAVGATRSHAVACVRALPISPSLLMKLGAAAGAAASVAGFVASLRRKKKLAEMKASSSSSYTSLLPMVLQLAAPVLLPLLQGMLKKISNPPQGGKDSQFLR